nr:hypothetical protein Hi04_10k_c2089_00048 [uncultured bacterium]
MSFKTFKRRVTVQESELHCDGPFHQGDTLLQAPTLEIRHGWDSPYNKDEGHDEQHFCSLKCLIDWANKPDHPV